MERKKLENDILQLLCTLNAVEIDLDTDINDCGINSMNFVQFIIALEDQYEIEVEDRYLNIKNFSNLKEVVDVIEKYLEER